MASDLLPVKRDYGERQRTADTYRQAGVSTTPPEPNRPVLPPPAPTPTPARQIAQPAMTDDPLAVMEPLSPLTQIPTPQERLQAIAARTTNPLLRLAAIRVAERSQ
jgi:hypothetical protein